MIPDTAHILRDPERLAALRASGLLEAERVPTFDRLARVAATAFRTPVAQVNLLAPDRQIPRACFGPEPWASGGPVSLDFSYCQHVVASGQPLLVEDARTHPLTRENQATTESGVVAYAAVPLTTGQGHTLGSLCVVDFAPRLWSVEDAELLRELAAVAIDEIESRLRSAGVLADRDAALRASEERLARIIASAMDAIITTDEHRRVLMFNTAAERLFGVPAEEAIGSSLDRFVPPRFRTVHAEHVRSFGETGVTTRSMHRAPGWLPALRADGTEFPVEATISQTVSSGQRLFTVVLRDVSERVRAEAALRRAKEEAEAVSRAKSQFLATMSHEVRTPINAVIGYAELLEIGLAGPLTEAQSAYLKRIRGSSQHLLGVVNDILDLAKIEADAVEVELAPHPMRPTLLGAVQLVEPQAATRGVRLDGAGECAPAVMFLGDPDRVRQILANLLSNAVKFTEPGGWVAVRARVWAEADPGARLAGEGPWVALEIEDSGIGIAAEHLQHIFEPFTQADGGFTRRHEGTGLGLTISRRLARLMGGDLTVRSRPGQGSRFTLWLRAAGVAR